METTVRALVRSLVRHVVLAVLFGAAAVALFSLQRRLVAESRPPHPHGAVITRTRLVANVAAAPTPEKPAEPTRGSILEIVTWSTIMSGGIACYHVWQFRGKTRRYLNQRHRAANELLRQDFRRMRGV